MRELRTDEESERRKTSRWKFTSRSWETADRFIPPECFVVTWQKLTGQLSDDLNCWIRGCANSRPRKWGFLRLRPGNSHLPKNRSQNVVGMNWSKPWEKCPGRRGLVLRLKPARHRDIMEIWADWRRRLLRLSPFSLIMSPCSRFMNLFERERENVPSITSIRPRGRFITDRRMERYSRRGEKMRSIYGDQYVTFGALSERYVVTVFQYMWYDIRARGKSGNLSAMSKCPKKSEKNYSSERNSAVCFMIYFGEYGRKNWHGPKEIHLRSDRAWNEQSWQVKCAFREKNEENPGEFSLSCRLAFNPDDTW